jgi:hypothetical protein
MSVSCECCVLSGRGLCDELVPRPEESYRQRCVPNVCDHETSTKRGGPGPYKAVEPYKKINFIITGLHNKPHGCGASVASAAGPFTKEKKIQKAKSKGLSVNVSRLTEMNTITINI